MTTPLLALKELSVSQAAKEADHNETCRDLELFANLRFLDRDLATPPGSPAESDAYLVAGSPTGAWAGQAGNIAWYRGGIWKFHAPYEGLVAWVNDEGVFLAYDGAMWAQITGSGSLSLYQLLDVDLPVSAGQADGTVLTWDAAGQVWVAEAPTGGTTFASAAEYRAGTEAAKALAPDQVWAAAAYVALTPGANVAVDMATGFNFTLAMGGNYTLDNPTNTKAGQTGCIAITQDGTGTRTLAYGTSWEFADGTAPVLSTAAGAKDLLFYQVLGATSVYANLVKAVA